MRSCVIGCAWYRHALAATVLAVVTPLAFAQTSPDQQPLPTPTPIPVSPAAPPPPPIASGDLAAPVPPVGTEPFRNAAPPSSFGAGGGFGEWANPIVGHVPYRADFRIEDFPDEPVRGQGTNLGYVESDLGITVPIWQQAPDEWAATVRIRSEFFHTGAILPDTDQAFPDELWDIRFGTTYRHLFDNGWIAGGSISFGSASDRPFSNFDVLTLGVNAFLRVPEGEHNAWLFTLSYSPTSELPFPIPGVAFVWQPSDCFRMNIGLPFQVWYRPTDELTLEFSYMLLRTVHTRATYRFCPSVAVFGGYDWENEGWFLADRPDDNEDRLYYYDMRLSGGLQFFLGHGATLDLMAGYVFDRFYFEGRSFADNGFDRVDVGNGPYASLRFAIRF